MAGQEGASDSRQELWQDELVEKLMPDPAQSSNAVALVGWLGKSTRDGYRRLYFTPELNEYAEFKEEDVIQAQSLGSEQTEGPTTVWVRKDANLEHVRTVSRQAQAEFLGGELTASLSPRSAQEGLQVLGDADIQVSTLPCAATIALCPSFFQLCPGDPTLNFRCPPPGGGSPTRHPSISGMTRCCSR